MRSILAPHQGGPAGPRKACLDVTIRSPRHAFGNRAPRRAHHRFGHALEGARPDPAARRRLRDHHLQHRHDARGGQPRRDRRAAPSRTTTSITSCRRSASTAPRRWRTTSSGCRRRPTACSPTTSTRRPISRATCATPARWLPIEQIEMDCGVVLRERADGPHAVTVAGASRAKAAIASSCTKRASRWSPRRARIPCRCSASCRARSRPNGRRS